jgi:hypothetical protein
MYCPKCGTRNGMENAFCVNCGAKLPRPSDDQSVVATTEVISGGARPSLVIEEPGYESFVGENAAYYVSNWKAIEQTGGKISWNWSAFFFGPTWVGYRKMYLPMWISIAILAGGTSIEFAVGLPDLVSWVVTVWVWVFFGLFGNLLYLKHAKRKLAEIRIRTNQEEERHRQARKQGGVSWLAAFSVIGIWVLLIILLVGTAGNYGTRLSFNGGELYYTSSVTPYEAQRLGNYLVVQGFYDGREKTVQLNRQSATYQVRIVIKRGLENDPSVVQTMKSFASEISQNVFDGASTDIHLCDERLNTIRVVIPLY